MLSFGLVLGVNFISLALGCTPIITHDQNRFCQSDYAFTGVVLQSRETNTESVFQIQLTSNLKGRISFPGQLLTIYGQGALHSCGPHRLNRSQGHVLYVYNATVPGESTRFRIAEHHTFNPINVNRVVNYDCSCEIDINIPPQPSAGSTAAPEDKCVITENEFDCTFRQGFCSRRTSPLGDRRCRWITPNVICPQS